MFIYNGDGQRVRKIDSTGTTKHVWDGQNILLETDGSNIIQVVYTLQPMLYGNLISQTEERHNVVLPVRRGPVPWGQTEFQFKLELGLTPIARGRLNHGRGSSRPGVAIIQRRAIRC